MTVEASGVQADRSARRVVEAGTTTTVDLTLELGEMTESVTVAGTQPLIRHDHHQVGGVVTRDQIERLPLNGRNFLELAKLEPGVTNPARLADGRVFVSSLGGGLQTIPRIGSTRVTVDGASISTPGTVGVLLQVSQDVVQEFQIATVNFDLTSSLTSNGAINIVTRSGGNAYHGSGFYFHRDHHLAAYPGLSRDPRNADPSFERRQFGSHVGGPLRKDRAFFFGSYERTDQSGVVFDSADSTNLLRSAESSPVPTWAISSMREWTCSSIGTTTRSRGTRTIATARSRTSGRPACLPAGPAASTRRIRAWRRSPACCPRAS